MHAVCMVCSTTYACSWSTLCPSHPKCDLLGAWTVSGQHDRWSCSHTPPAGSASPCEWASWALWWRSPGTRCCQQCVARWRRAWPSACCGSDHQPLAKERCRGLKESTRTDLSYQARQKPASGGRHTHTHTRSLESLPAHATRQLSSKTGTGRVRSFFSLGPLPPLAWPSVCACRAGWPCLVYIRGTDGWGWIGGWPWHGLDASSISMMTGDNGEASPDYIPGIRTSCFSRILSSIPCFYHRVDYITVLLIQQQSLDSRFASQRALPSINHPDLPITYTIIQPTTTHVITAAITMYSRRDSAGSQTSSSRHRPKLLRSSATAPSITPSSSIQASLVSPHSPQRAAADLLSKVAVYVPHTSASSVPPSNPIMIDGARGSTSSSASGDMSSSLSG